MQSTVPRLAGAALCVALLSSCATMPPTGSMVSLYQEAMAAAARPPTRSEEKPAPQAGRATRAVEVWRGGSAGADAPQSEATQF